MLKRPLLVAGLAALIISAVIVRFFGQYYYPDADLKNGEYTEFECRIRSIEEKNGSYYIFVRAGRFVQLLVLAKHSSEVLSLKTGNRIIAKCSYAEWNTARNRGNFDEKQYYRSIGIYQKFILRSYTVTDSSYSLPGEILSSLRNKLSGSIYACADKTSAGILDSMVTGYRSGIDTETRDLLQMGGIAHIIAISGLHISFIGMGIYRILKKKLSLIPAAVFSVMTVALYCAMSGWTASSVRAFIMLAVSIGAEIAGRKYDMLSSTCLAGSMLLISNPFYVTNTGFLMSFSAVFSLAVISGPVAGYICPGYEKILRHRKSQSDLKIRICARSATIFSASFSVSAFTLPLIINTYFEYSAYSPLLNMIVLALMPYILAGALLGAAAGMVSPALGRIVIGLPVYLVNIICRLCRAVGDLPAGRITAGHRNIWNVIAYYALLISVYAAVHLISKKRRIKGVLLRIAALLVMQAAMACIISYRQTAPGITVSFIDSGQGECILLKNDTGGTYLFDAGSSSVSDVWEYRIESALKYKGIGSIDHMIVTHPDTDHVSGLIELLEEETGGMEIGSILIGDFTGNENYEKILALADRKNIPVTGLHRGIEIRDGNVNIKCVYAEESKYITDTNERSAVMYVIYGDFSALITGDISSRQEKKIAEEWDEISEHMKDPGLDLLDIAHHGSRYSSCEEFLAKVKPENAVISAGTGNSYGHPHKETLERLKECGAAIYCTADRGETDVTAQYSGTVKIISLLEP